VVRLGVIGTWTWQPNRDALFWLLHEVAPHLPPEVELWVAGRGVPDHWPGARARGVRVLGPVPLAQDFYRELDVLALPSLHGSGVQEKAIEALGTGLPVVATPHAMRGLGEALPPQVRLAQDPRTFARLCATAGGCEHPHAQAVVDAWALARRTAYRHSVMKALEASSTAPPWRA
jgi:glycosyltransferase involved in cell wall biosynthesis